MESGESAEQAVHREVLEETGVMVDDVVYRGQPAVAVPASLMLGYEARAVGGEVETGDDELEDVRWFTREELRARRRHVAAIGVDRPLADHRLARPRLTPRSRTRRAQRSVRCDEATGRRRTPVCGE